MGEYLWREVMATSMNSIINRLEARGMFFLSLPLFPFFVLFSIGISFLSIYSFVAKL
jgi:hypothetical protein